MKINLNILSMASLDLIFLQTKSKKSDLKIKLEQIHQKGVSNLTSLLKQKKGKKFWLNKNRVG
jgi:hypothetical protein